MEYSRNNNKRVVKCPQQGCGGCKHSNRDSPNVARRLTYGTLKKLNTLRLKRTSNNIEISKMFLDHLFQEAKPTSGGRLFRYPYILGVNRLFARLTQLWGALILKN
jgi:hypothetical protein